MKTFQLITDRLAIALSLACVIHCLALPIILIAVPSIVAVYLDSEYFHMWMVLAAIPTSIYALTLGCKEHKRNEFIVIAAIGLIFLLSALFLGEAAEQPLTVAGASFLSLAHWLNYRLCGTSKLEKCDCPETEGSST